MSAPPREPARTPVAGHVPLRVSFELTDQDLRTVYQRYYEAAYAVNGPRLPLKRRMALWVGVAVCAAGLLGCLIARSEGADIPMFVIVLLLVAMCMLLSTLAENRRDRRHKAAEALDRTLKSCVLDSLVGRWIVELTDEGVRADYAAESRLIKWPGVWGFHIDEGFASIIGIDSRSIIIPLRAFDEPREASAEAFVAAGDARLAAAGHGFRARLVEHLALHDVFCPRCKYNLRGGGPRCPECGWMLAPENVPEAFGRRAAHAGRAHPPPGGGQET